jgi:hypothetical protein
MHSSQCPFWLRGQAKEAAVDVRLWRKRHAAARVRREFRTAEEVLNEAAEQPAAAPKQTILDMRGPQVQGSHLAPLLHCRRRHGQ